MTSNRKIKMILTGAYAGKTGELAGCRFVNGVHELIGPLHAFEGVIKVLSFYGAFMEGSDELREAQERDNGGSGIQVPSQGADNSGVRTASRPATETSERSGHDGNGRGPVGMVPEGPTETERHMETVQEEVPVGKPNFRQEKIKGILLGLDPDVDAYWTSTGLVRLSALEMTMDETGILRNEVEAALPGWTRDKAREQKQQIEEVANL